MDNPGGSPVGAAQWTPADRPSNPGVILRLLTAFIALLTLSGAATAVAAASAAGTAPGVGTAITVPGDPAQVDELLPAGYRNPRTAEQAVQWALSQVGVQRDSGYCLRFVDLAYGRTSGPASAYQVWTQSPASLHHVSGTPPRGAVVVWSSAIGGGHGHIAVSLGGGRMVSTTGGAVAVLDIQGFADSAYLGWMPPYFYM